MKTKLLKAFSLVLAISILFCALPVSAAEEKSIVQSVLDFKLEQAQAKSIQDWINGELTENAGSTSEWFIITLRQMGEYDFSSYGKALEKYITENEISSASTREKYALALITSGGDSQVITEILDNSIGEQGIMSWVFGLHIMNNGYASQKYSLDEVIENILSYQLADGSYALYGEKGDVDTTAMTVQAIAPYYKEEKIKNAIDKSISYLSKNQTEKGGYISRGVENLESSAQVLVALCALGIDCKVDERFIKNGNTLFDAILEYKLDDGSFCHIKDSGYNNMATVQAFYSSVAYNRMKEGKNHLFVFEESQEKIEETSEGFVSEEDFQSTEASTIDISQEKTETHKSNYKIIVCIAVGFIALAVCSVMFVLKKRNKKNYIFVVAVAIIVILFVVLTNFQSTEEYYNNDSKEDIIGKATVSVYCHTVAGQKDHIPENGIILDSEEIEIAEGETVYNLLLEALSENKIHLETNGAGESIYVEGIANIYEFDFGDLSGWMFFVNGKEASVSCGEYKLNDGDIIEWKYTCQMGEDLE